MVRVLDDIDRSLMRKYRYGLSRINVPLTIWLAQGRQSDYEKLRKYDVARLRKFYAAPNAAATCPIASCQSP
jgi:hypothetical protein